jgi:hypothetical protein
MGNHPLARSHIRPERKESVLGRCSAEHWLGRQVTGPRGLAAGGRTSSRSGRHG